MLLGAEDLGGAGLEVEVTDQAAADVVTEDEDRGVGDMVIGLGALLASADDAGTCEGLEVAGDVGLADGGAANEVGDVLFSFFEGHEEVDTRGFAKDFEAGGDEIDGFGAQGASLLAFLGFTDGCCHLGLRGRIYQAGEEGNRNFSGRAVQGLGALI